MHKPHESPTGPKHAPMPPTTAVGTANRPAVFKLVLSFECDDSNIMSLTTTKTVSILAFSAASTIEDIIISNRRTWF